MPLTYKINVLEELKKRGYSTNRLRQERILSESVIQHLRDKQPVSMTTLDKLCGLLSIDISDLIEYKPGLPKEIEFEKNTMHGILAIARGGIDMDIPKDYILKTISDAAEALKNIF